MQSLMFIEKFLHQNKPFFYHPEMAECERTYVIKVVLPIQKEPNITGAALLGGQDGHLPTQFSRDQRQKIPQNCKIRAICKNLL